MQIIFFLVATFDNELQYCFIFLVILHCCIRAMLRFVNMIYMNLSRYISTYIYILYVCINSYIYVYIWKCIFPEIIFISLSGVVLRLIFSLKYSPPNYHTNLWLFSCFHMHVYESIMHKVALKSFNYEKMDHFHIMNSWMKLHCCTLLF